MRLADKEHIGEAVQRKILGIVLLDILDDRSYPVRRFLAALKPARLHGRLIQRVNIDEYFGQADLAVNFPAVSGALRVKVVRESFDLFQQAFQLVFAELAAVVEIPVVSKTGGKVKICGGDSLYLLRIEVDQAELVGYFVVFAHAAVKIRIIYDKQRTAPNGVYLVVNVHFTISGERQQDLLLFMKMQVKLTPLLSAKKNKHRDTPLSVLTIRSAAIRLRRRVFLSCKYFIL